MRLWRTLGRLFLVALLTLGALGLWVRFTPSGAHLTAHLVTAWVNERLDGRLTLDGLTVHGPYTFEGQNLILYSAQGDTLANIPRLSLRLSSWSFRRDGIRVARVEVQSPTVHWVPNAPEPVLGWRGGGQGDGLRLNIRDLMVRDGHLRLNDASMPSRLKAIDVDAKLVVRPSGIDVTLERLSAHLLVRDADVQPVSARGTWTLRGASHSIDEAEVRVGNSLLTANGRWRPRVVDLRLTARLDTFLRDVLLPNLSIDALDAEVELGGSPNRLELTSVHLRAMEAEAHLQGLYERDEDRASVQVRSFSSSPALLRAVGNALPSRLQPILARARLSGSVSLQAVSKPESRTAAWSVQGTLGEIRTAIAGSWSSRGVTFRTTETRLPAPLLHPAWTGSFTLRAEGRVRRDGSGDGALLLVAWDQGPISLDTVRVQGAWTAADVSLDWTTRLGEGLASGSHVLSRANSTHTAHLDLQSANLAVLLPDGPLRETRISGVIDVEGALARPRVTAEFAEVWLARPNVAREVGPISLSFDRQENDLIRAQGGFGSLEAEGFPDAQALLAVLGRLQTVTLNALLPVQETRTDTLPALAPHRWQFSARLQSDALALLAHQEEVRGDIEATGYLGAQPDGRPEANVELTIPRLLFAQGRLYGMSGRAEITAQRVRLLGTMSLGEFAGQSLRDTRMLLNAHPDGGSVVVESRMDTARAFLNARIQPAEAGTEVLVQGLGFPLGMSILRLSGPARVNVQRTRVEVRGFEMEDLLSEATSLLTLNGSLSTTLEDTLRIRTTRLPLPERLGNLPISGLVTSDVTLTGLLGQPRGAGTVRIEPFSLLDKPLGAVDARFNWLPDREELALDMAWQDADPLVQMRVAGAIALHPDTLSKSLLRLDVDAPHLSGALLTTFFPNSLPEGGGHVRLSGRVRGTLDAPEPELDVRAEALRINLPGFGLRYATTGNLVLDRRGLHTTALSVSDLRGGTAQLAGSALFGGEAPLTFDVRGVMQNVTVLDDPSRRRALGGRLVGSGTGTLRGPFNRAVLTANDLQLSPASEVLISVISLPSEDNTFIRYITQTPEAGRVEEEVPAVHPVQTFVRGLTLELNVTAPQGTRLVLLPDPVRDDIIRATGLGAMQVRLREGDLGLFGRFDLNEGSYFFTAGDVFVRNFSLDSGSLIWEGPASNPRLDLSASYRTRASLDGLPTGLASRRFVPLVVQLDLTESLQAPSVTLRLTRDRDNRSLSPADDAILEAALNQPDRQAEYATSVLLTNSFVLTTDLVSGRADALTEARNQLAFNSVAQLVAAQVNQYLATALPALQVTLGLTGEAVDTWDLTYGVSLRLRDERLIIRGQGVLQNERDAATSQGFQGEVMVTALLAPDVALDLFFRREDDVFENLTTSTTGLSLSYQTQFHSWPRFFRWLRPARLAPEQPAPASAVDPFL